MLRQMFQWVVYSSADPSKISRTLKGLVPFLVLLGVGDVVQTDINSVIDLLTEVLVTLTTLASGAYALYGAVAKLYNSVVN